MSARRRKGKVKKKGKKKAAGRLAVRRLERAILTVSSDPASCARDPERDFTRDRKLPLGRVLWTMVTWGNGTIGVELEDAEGWTGDAPTASAFCQQRAKLRDDVMPRVNSALLGMCEQQPFAGRFVLYGVDGTDLQLCPSGDPRTRVRSNQSGASHNEAHPTIVYDIKRRTSRDMAWQGSKEQDEPGSLCRLVDRTPPAYAPDGKRLVPLWLGDRGFYSYNVLCHLLEAGHSFVLRMQDDHVEALLGKDNVPEGCFDVTVERIFVRTTSLAARSRPDEPEVYRHADSHIRFDAIGAFNFRAEYAMRLRVVRRRLPARDGDGRGKDRWLNLVTNLTGPEFPARWIVRTYRKRWDHEVGFRHLKRVVGMHDPKTRDFERAGMEAWGRLILYNACSLGAARLLRRRTRGRKHKRRVDLTTAFTGMLRMVRRRRFGGRKRRRMDLERSCGRHTHAVIGGRSFDRRRRNKSPAKLGYRG